MEFTIEVSFAVMPAFFFNKPFFAPGGGGSIGPNRILTKIDQIIMAIKYTLRQKFMKSDQVNEVLERLSAWKKAFSKRKFSAGFHFSTSMFA